MKILLVLAIVGAFVAGTITSGTIAFAEDDDKNLDNVLLRGDNIIMVSLPNTPNQKDDDSI